MKIAFEPWKQTCDWNLFQHDDHRCDVIKQNESELTNTDFKIKQNKADNFFVSFLFLQLFNCPYI